MPDEFKDEKLFLGACLNRPALVQQPMAEQGLGRIHFRFKTHPKIFQAVVDRFRSGDGPLNIEQARNSGDEVDRYAAQLAASVAPRVTQVDEETAKMVVHDYTVNIIGAIRDKQDLAIWLRELFAACGRKEFKSSDYLLGVGIGYHVKFETGRSYPGDMVLVRETGLSLSTINRAISNLQEGGHLAVDHRRPRMFTPLVQANLATAKQATEQKPTAAKPAPAKPAPQPNVIVHEGRTEDDEIPF